MPRRDDPSPDERLTRFALRHHGLVRTSDAARLGLSEQQLWRRVRSGRLERVGRGVVRIAGAPRTRHQEVLAATWLAGGPASHRTAAELVGLWHDRHPPEVTVARAGVHELPGMVIHRSRDLDRARLVRRFGIRCTDVDRTLVDLGAVVPVRRVEQVLHDALVRRLTTLDAVTAEYLSLSRRGRHGCGPIGAVLRSVDPLVQEAESRLEVVLLAVIRDHGLPEPELQYEVTAGGRSFRLDVCYPAHRLFIEGDGFGVHGTRTAFEEDRWRQNLLVVDGWRVLRFTWRQLLQRPAEVAAHIRRGLELAA